MYLRIEKKEERCRHGGANQIFLGGAQRSFKYSRRGRVERKREREALERESERSHLISSLLRQRDTGANKKWHGGRLGGVMVVAVMGIMDVMERSTIYVASSIPVKLATLTNMRYKI
ncbi:hypothetical protein Bca52824_026408 [Brassica carinata]|uniref:Uncharacterized protein n=1 Tax=Brassica carinata TaxID=52824 RepID=A0A8X7V7W2_BRACI|nr:hypothetical protein Bca52824_026408 [Brassica carinata]